MASSQWSDWLNLCILTQDAYLSLLYSITAVYFWRVKIFNIPEQPDTWIEVELEEEWVIPEKMPYSRCGWTVFKGMRVRGSVRRVVLRGELAYLDGRVLAPKGFGQDILFNYVLVVSKSLIAMHMWERYQWQWTHWQRVLFVLLKPLKSVSTHWAMVHPRNWRLLPNWFPLLPRR